MISQSVRWIAALGFALSLGVQALPAAGAERGPLRLAQAPDECVYRCRVLREECTDDAKRQSRPDAACWTSYAQCRDGCSGAAAAPEAPQGGPGGGGAPAQVGAAADAPPADAGGGVEEVTLEPRVVPVGKWAEGVTFDGRALWVAESGQRSIVAVDAASGSIIRRVTVGRLPVGMTFGDGRVFALVNTDKLVWQQPTGSERGRPLTGLGECADGIVFGAGTLWALTQPDCSSASSRVVRIDPRSGAPAPSRPLGEWASAVAVHDGNAWVAHARGPAVSVVDRRSLAVTKVEVEGASLWAITATDRFVYVGGRLGDDGAQGIVAAIDPASRREIARQTVDERIQAIAADDRHVAAVGESGRIWVFSAEALEPTRVIGLAGGPIKARAAIIAGDDLVVTNQQSQGENGAVLILSDWRPGEADAAADPAPQPPAAGPGPGQGPQAGPGPTRPPLFGTAPPPAPKGPARPPLFGGDPPPAPPLSGGTPRAPQGPQRPPLFAAVPPPAPAGGFGVDCGAPRSPSERVVCADPQLAALDGKLAEAVALYVTNIVSEAVGGKPSDQRAFVRKHADWTRVRDRCGPVPGCLRTAYRARLKVMAELNQPE